MIVLFITLAVVIIFGFVVMFGAPYLPTMKPQTDAALDLLDLKAGQTMLELGSGDGRVMRAAAERGWKVVGYELNPILVLISRVYTWRYRKQVRVVWGNYWLVKWPEAHGVYVFMLDRYMKKLDKKITQTYAGKKVKLVSYAFPVPGKKPKKTHKGLFLYDYK